MGKQSRLVFEGHLSHAEMVRRYRQVIASAWLDAGCKTGLEPAVP